MSILYVAGCSGHGLAIHSLMGLLLAEKINGVESKTLAALRHDTPSTFPEPLQWLGLKGAFAAAKLYDGWTTAKLPKPPLRTRRGRPA